MLSVQNNKYMCSFYHPALPSPFTGLESNVWHRQYHYAAVFYNFFWTFICLYWSIYAVMFRNVETVRRTRADTEGMDGQALRSTGVHELRLYVLLHAYRTWHLSYIIGAHYTGCILFVCQVPNLSVHKSVFVGIISCPYENWCRYCSTVLPVDLLFEAKVYRPARNYFCTLVDKSILSRLRLHHMIIVLVSNSICLAGYTLCPRFLSPIWLWRK